jgi:signal transduction histidine kinase
MPVPVLILNIALILVLAASMVLILRRGVLARRVPALLCLFPILPVGQLFMLRSFAFDGWSAFWLIGLSLGFAAYVLLLICTISQEKKTSSEEALRETRHRIELERIHYEAVEQRRRELDRIRRDFSQKLEAIAGFARSGGTAEAREGIFALAGRIDGTKEKPYCAIPVVNAVLAEKAQNCAAAGINLSVDLNLPEDLAVEPMHLCSIFCNLLDNAIAACKTARDGDGTAAERGGGETTERGGGRPVIRLSSLKDGDYLFIKAVNPSAEPKCAGPGRGYGLRILSELAGRYGGDFQSDYRDGTFTAVVSLLAADTKTEE